MAAALTLTSCSSTPPLPKFAADVGDQDVLLSQTGQGSATFTIPAAASLIPGGQLTIDASCNGTGTLSVRVLPGGESDNPTCLSHGGGVGWSKSGPAPLPWPRTVTVTAPKKARWRIIIVNPQNAIGVATISG